jgi:hypothetical protein
MTFAENNRISHRQLYRQMILTFTAPFLLCLFGRNGIGGIMGILGTAAAVLLLLFYVIFLIRLTPCYEGTGRYKSPLLTGILMVFYLIYVILAGAFLLRILGNMIVQSVLVDVPEWLVGLLAVLTVLAGPGGGFQKRGRMAEVSGALLLGALLLMMALGTGSAHISYLQEMFARSRVTWSGFLENGYLVLCAFSGIGLIPFLLPHVEKAGSAWKPAACGILSVGGILEGMLFLLPAVFGWERQKSEMVPVLPLLSGTDLPGNVLARFDILWIGFVLYGLLFSIGSLFHYGHEILGKLYPAGSRSFHWGISLFLGSLVFALSRLSFAGRGISAYFPYYLAWIFVPGQLLLQMVLFFRGRGRQKKRITAFLTLLSLLFTAGCAGTEPEKRMYPLALGVTREAENVLVSLGMPDLSKTTGQEKPEEGTDPSVLTIRGQDFAEIESEYSRSQEKSLDLGHLEVVVLANSMIQSGGWQAVLTYLKEEPGVGENIYVFRAGNPEEILSWQSGSGVCAGEYLTGILENKESAHPQQGVTLREVYYSWYENGELPSLPEVILKGDSLEIIPTAV